MSMRVQQRPLEGTAEVWDPQDPEPFRSAAGDQFVAVDGEDALVRSRGGEIVRVPPGWYAVRLDASPGGPAVVVAADAVGDGEDSLYRVLPAA